MNQETPAAYVERLFDAWYIPLLQYACRLVKQRPSAEEIVQDTFLDLYKALQAGQRVEYPKAWTMSVVRHKAGERLSQPFGTERTHELLDSTDFAAEWVESVDLEIDCERVRAHMDLLSVREHEVLLLRLESMKYREIAAALGITVNSVNTHLARALEKFQAAFARPAADARKRSR